MGLKPNPQPLKRELSIDEVDDHRDDACEHYEMCLVRMAMIGGKKRASWSCQDCPLFDRRLVGRYPRRP